MLVSPNSIEVVFQGRNASTDNTLLPSKFIRSDELDDLEDVESVELSRSTERKNPMRYWFALILLGVVIVGTITGVTVAFLVANNSTTMRGSSLAASNSVQQPPNSVTTQPSSTTQQLPMPSTLDQMPSAPISNPGPESPPVSHVLPSQTLVVKRNPSSSMPQIPL